MFNSAIAKLGIHNKIYSNDLQIFNLIIRNIRIAECYFKP